MQTKINYDLNVEYMKMNKTFAHANRHLTLVRNSVIFINIKILLKSTKLVIFMRVFDSNKIANLLFIHLNIFSRSLIIKIYIALS